MAEAVLEVTEERNYLVIEEPSNLIFEDTETEILEIALVETKLVLPEDSVKILSIGTEGPAGYVGADGPQGPQGPQGPPGPAGASGDTTYVHVQLAPLSTWNVVHNLGKYPSVMVVDSADSVVVGEIQYIDANSLTITFSSAFGGKAYIN